MFSIEGASEARKVPGMPAQDQDQGRGRGLALRHSRKLSEVTVKEKKGVKLSHYGRKPNLLPLKSYHISTFTAGRCGYSLG